MPTVRLVPCAALALAVAVSAAAADPTGGFPAVVKKHFAAWDKDGNGELSLAEINRLVTDPAVKGPEAAAVVALRRAAVASKAKPGPFTADGLQASAKADTSDLAKSYATALKRIESANRELFAKGVPTFSELRQGKLGDCFCLAPLGSMVNRDPAEVAKMICRRPDGSHVVTFGNRKVTVPPPTDAELALTSSTGPDGVWVNVYEKAIAEARNAAKPADQKAATVVDAITRGGSAGIALQAITGHKIVRFGCKQVRDAVTPAEREAKLKELRGLLTKAGEEKRLMTCGTAGGGPKVKGLYGNHAYAVLGYDPTADEILLWDPHGGQFTPQGPAGLENGFPIQHGKLRMPLPAFCDVFAGLAFETAEAAENTTP